MKKILSLLRYPITGAVLNVFIFGAADICAGQLRQAVGKLLVFLIFPFLAVLILDGIDQAFDSGLPAVWAGYLLRLVYIVFVAIDGYRTFQRVYGQNAP